MVIGGAEDKIRDRVILNRFAALAGGSDAVVVVISTASSLGFEAGERYREIFTGLGIETVRPLHAMSRAQANDPAYVRQLDDATGIFLTGGNQLRLSSTIGGTLLADAVLERFRHGAVVAGTSAGASAMSSHMIAFGASGGTPKHRMAALAAGLGVDEDTAGVVGPDGVMEVIGRGSVTIIDGAHAETDAWEVKGHRPVMISGVILHALPSGYKFDLRHRNRISQPELKALPGGNVAST